MPTLASDWSTSDDADLDTDAAWWLKDPNDPSLNTPVTLVAADFNYTEIEQQETVAPLGEDREVTVRGELLGAHFDLPFLVTTQADYDAIRTLRNQQVTLLLQSDMGKQWYIDLGPEWNVSMKVTQNRRSAPLRIISITAVEADMPGGTVASDPYGGGY